MNDVELQKIRDGLSGIADLIEENEFLCSPAPCPKCGYGVTGACYGCEIKRLKKKLASGILIDYDILDHSKPEAIYDMIKKARRPLGQSST